MKPDRGLILLSFFAADVQAGVGPFLGVFLQSHGWHPDTIGMVMTIAGIAGMLVTSPAGALVDRTKFRRLVIIGASAMTVAASLAIWIAQSFWMVTISQVATTIAGAALGPALAGLTLGVVQHRNFNRQFARNQVANHAGNAVAAALSGWLGWRFGIGAVFALSATLGLLSIASVLTIPARTVNYHRARGLVRNEQDEHDDPRAGKFQLVLHNRPLMVLAIVFGLFNLGNSALMPLYGLSVVASGHGNLSTFTAQTIIIAQIVMLLAAAISNQLIQRCGYWWIMLITILILPLRGVIAATIIQAWGVWPMQSFDGLCAGLQSVVVPALVVRLLQGTGRVNLGQGVVQTVAAVGASISPALGGMLAYHLGYSSAFLILGSIAAAPLLVWLVFGKLVRDASGIGEDWVPEGTRLRTSPQRR